MKSGFRTLRPAWRVGPVGLGIVAALATGARLLPPMSANPSGLLNSVKNNTGMAEQLCQEFDPINAAGHSVYSPEVLERVASRRGISTSDAEILITYVVGLHCPHVID